MYSKHFNLEQPEENYLNEAFTAYTKMKLGENEMRDRLAADFPMLDDRYVYKAEELLHDMFRPTNFQKDYATKIDWIRFCTSAEYIDPAGSWNKKQFIRKLSPSICVVLHIRNYAYGTYGCNQKYRIYGEDRTGKSVLLEEIDVKFDKDDLCRDYMILLDLDDVAPAGSEYSQDLDITARFLMDGQEYSECYERLTIINTPEAELEFNGWEMSAGLDGSSSNVFNLHDTLLIYNDISIDTRHAGCNGKLDFIEAEVIIWHSNLYREMFRSTVRLEHAGGSTYRFRAPLVALKYDGKVLAEAEDKKGDIVPVYEWSCGSFDATLTVWGKEIASSKVCFYDREETISFPPVKAVPEEDTIKKKVREDIFEVVRLDKFCMYNAPGTKEDDQDKLTDVDDTALMTGFRKELTGCIAVHASYIVLDEGPQFEKMKDEATCRLYDETGRTLTEKKAFTAYFDKVWYVYTGLGGFTDYNWEKGKYRVEFLWEDNCIAAATFEVGDRCVDGTYDVHHIMQMIRKQSQKNESEDAYGQLMSMTGLKSIKDKITRMKNLVEFSRKRIAAGLPAKTPSLHTCFIGNPGTGKTTVAKLLGQIYKDLGLLSKGEVVFEERKTLLGRFYDSENKSVANAVERAQGGILFIDEAYNLYVKDDPKDPGHRILENLLTELSDDTKRDWMLILAGYTAEMQEMISSNPGLRSRIPEDFYFEDYSEDELMDIADIYCRKYRFNMTDNARIQLRTVIRRELSVKTEQFGNGRFINNLMDEIVTSNMASRLASVKFPTEEELKTIKAQDIPSIRRIAPSKGIEGLKEMIGLSEIKRSIESHMNFVRMMNMRIQSGLGGEMPPLHMIFTGNPGTGKTTVAAIMGEIYASMGIISHGNVISVERSDMVGSHIGETELKVKALLNRAKGNVLFIDEAYQLYQEDNDKDFGKTALETLLTSLSKESIDMIVILAGYSKEMEKLIGMNTGIKSRFPYTFHFEDYSVDELVSIALHTVRKQNYEFTPEALEMLRLLIKREVTMKDSSFGNARFVKRLINTKILPTMADRLAKMTGKPSLTEMKTIRIEDIPISSTEAAMTAGGGFNEAAIARLLERLDRMTGLEKVKSAIHNFVDIARYLNSHGESIAGKGTFKWSFTGNTGTGKSTVAEILAGLLHAMNLIPSDKVFEVKGEEIFNVSEYQCNMVLTDAIRKSRYGMLFIDGDAPEFRNGGYYLTTELLKIKLSSLMAELGSVGATVIAENTSKTQSIANSLAANGIYDFDHTFIFDDYDSQQLYEILCSCLGEFEMSFAPEAENTIRKYITDLRCNRDTTFANARTMKLLSRTIRDIVLLRLSRQGNEDRTILSDDVESFTWKGNKTKIGF